MAAKDSTVPSMSSWENSVLMSDRALWALSDGNRAAPMLYIARSRLPPVRKSRVIADPLGTIASLACG